MANEPTVLVTGAGGNLGGRVVELLLEQNYPGKIIAGTRDPSKLAAFSSRGVETRRLDWDDEAALAASFAGADRALIISGDKLEGRSEKHVRTVEAAAAAGVKHLSYTSMLAPERYQDIPIAPSHLATEQALQRSGVPYVALRNLWYTEVLIDTLKRALAEGKWVTAAADGKVAYVTREDCARAAAGVLAASDAPTGVLAVTGLEALSVRQIAAIATEITGNPIEVVAVTDAQMTEGMRAAHVPEEIISLVVGIERFNREGDGSQVTDTVERLTGRKPQGIHAFLDAHADALRG
jgi:NAD(P)H dehydrogenase (quinone)